MSIRRRLAVALVALVALTACSSDDGGDGDVAAFCSRFHQLSELVAAASVPPEEMEDVTAARGISDDIARAARRLPEVAPEPVANDVRRLAEVTFALASELRDFYQGILDDPARANDPKYLGSFQPVTDDRREALDAAGDEVRPYVDEHCGEPLPPAEPSEGTNPPPTGSSP